MKKKMLSAEIEFIKFSTDDVITTSGGGKILYSTNAEVEASEDSPAKTTGWTHFEWNQ